jgi:hypothetical protein
MFKLFSKIFGDDLIKNTGIIYTHWSQNKSEKKKRKEHEL